MSRIDTISPEDATGKTAELFRAAEKKMGAVPNVLRVLGHSPAALEAYLTLSDVLANTSFDAREREAIALTVAGANRCAYCASAHSFISSNLKVSNEEIEKRLEGRSADGRLQTALTFAKALVDKKGRVDDADLRAVRTGGLDSRATIDVIALTVVNILTNYTNHVAQTDIDFPEVSV